MNVIFVQILNISHNTMKKNSDQLYVLRMIQSNIK